MRFPEPDLQLRFFFQITIVMIVGLLGLVGFLWVSLGHTTARLAQSTRTDVVQEGLAVVRALEGSLRQNVANIDSTLRVMQAAYRRDPQSLDLEEWRQALAANIDGDLDLGLVGADGLYRLATARRLPNPWDANVADRIALSGAGQFWAHLNLTSGGGERLVSTNGPDVGARKPKWIVQFTKPLFRPSGEADGSLVLSVDLSHMGRVLEAAQPHRSVVSLVGTSGQLWGRHPAADGLPGATVGKPISAVALDAMREGETRIFEQDVRLHQGARKTTRVLFLSKRVGDLPFYVLLGYSMDERFSTLNRTWTRTFWSAVALTSIALALIALLGYIRYRMSRLELHPI